MNNHKVATLILAGGQGTRLFPLTCSRCKPAVTFGGRYRLIDIPISNALNSRFHNIYILSQYLASDLNHHVLDTYHLDTIQGGHLECLTPEDDGSHKLYFKGTADAVRKNMEYLLKSHYEYFLILSGDQLYHMDLNAMVDFGLRMDSDLTIATIPIEKKHASRMGLMRIDEKGHILDFVEKPKDPEVIDNYRLPPEFVKHQHLKGKSCYLASMGIYFFKRDALANLLKEDKREDFGKHLIPTQIRNHGKTSAFVYEGYWEDIGTIGSYYDATLSLTTNNIGLNFYNEDDPIHAHAVNLPSPRMTNTFVNNSIICDGSIIEAQEVSHSMIGLRTHIKKGSIIRDSIIMGNDSYDPTFSIGEDCRIEKTIIDENAHIGKGVRLVNKENIKKADHDLYYIRDGIIVIPSGAKIPDYFTL